MENPVQLSPRFTQAVDYARQVHVGLPVTEDMAIAALLHDALYSRRSKVIK